MGDEVNGRPERIHAESRLVMMRKSEQAQPS